MFPTTRLLQACRITLFTRANCSLCTNAKDTLFKVRDTRPFVYREIAVMEDGQKHWKDLYEFDTPVVGLPRPKLNQSLLIFFVRFMLAGRMLGTNSLNWHPKRES